MAAMLACVLGSGAAEVTRSGQTVTIRPDVGQARVVCLQVMNDQTVRVRATSAEALPEKAKSLIIVQQTAKPVFTVDEQDGQVVVKTARMQAVVSKQTGGVTFLDSEGRTLLKEAGKA